MRVHKAPLAIGPKPTRALKRSLVCLASTAGFGACLFIGTPARSASEQPIVPRFPMGASGLVLERPAHASAFFDVTGRRAALFGYEGRAMEAWVYPIQIVDDFSLAFQIEGNPIPIAGPEIMAHITVRPEATTLTYTHAAFTVRQISMAPLDAPGVVMLLDVESVRPLSVIASYRPRLSPMWPASLPTPWIGWDPGRSAHVLTEDRGRFVGLVGAPGARDVSILPPEEEPREHPSRFVFEVTPEDAQKQLFPIVIAGSVDGLAAAQATYDALLGTVPALVAENIAHYRRLEDETTQIDTPDDRLDAAFAWAKVGIDKGFVENPMLGTGLVAGYRTAGPSERPGYAWFFGRDALWTSLATTASGDFEATRRALDFLAKFQREDGKIPHEIAQSAALVPWFDEYPYAFASADATPLYVAALAAYFRASGDIDFIRGKWPSLLRAWRFCAATDTDGDGLIENTGVGHGWVESGALGGAHEEIYLQGVWIQASEGLAVLAEALGEAGVAARARAAARRAQRAVEATYWLEGEGRYAFATRLAPEPASPREQLDTTDTIMPAVPLSFGLLDDARAERALDHLGSAAIATDWGARILSAESPLYDPLSYHQGSVWPLFTGWASMAAYRYDRPLIGHQALFANALLTYQGALGDVTELLSGAFDTPIGLSSRHQIWSQAMVVTPALRGLFGLLADEGGRALRFAPQLPADWDRAAVKNVAVGRGRYDIELERASAWTKVRVARRPSGGGASGGAARLEVLDVAPALPLDATVRAVMVNGAPAPFEVTQKGDVQRARVVVRWPLAVTEVVIVHDPGTDVYVEHEPLASGAANQGLRVLRARTERGALVLWVEGLAGRTYSLRARSPHHIAGTGGVTVIERAGGEAEIAVAFNGPEGAYVQRRLSLPLSRP